MSISVSNLVTGAFNFIGVDVKKLARSNPVVFFGIVLAVFVCLFYVWTIGLSFMATVTHIPYLVLLLVSLITTFELTINDERYALFENGSTAQKLSQFLFGFAPLFFGVIVLLFRLFF